MTNLKKCFFLILLIIAFIFSSVSIQKEETSVNKENNSNSNDMEFGTEKLNVASYELSPNLSRIDYPIVLTQENAEEVWDELHGHHVDNIRIAYYSEDNEWQLRSFQIDEKAYFRTYKYVFS